VPVGPPRHSCGPTSGYRRKTPPDATQTFPTPPSHHDRFRTLRRATDKGRTARKRFAQSTHCARRKHFVQTIASACYTGPGKAAK
jgi:hypothetical protein